MNKGRGWSEDKELGEEGGAQRRGNSASYEAKRKALSHQPLPALAWLDRKNGMCCPLVAGCEAHRESQEKFSYKDDEPFL